MNATLTSIRGWSEAMLTSLVAAMAVFFPAIPKILAFAAILIIRWFVAALVASAIAAVLRRARFNPLRTLEVSCNSFYVFSPQPWSSSSISP
ncbi:mechanosensitive ion channel family protein [Bradyrhizobium centrolobii]|uniref:mechanosensitive ion channel family protein n=1 Tax=Bradyrhizobium centrolobii TaxID=1505087 RepID=UPI003D314103